METVKNLTEQLLKTLGIEPFSIEQESIAGTTFFSVKTDIELAGIGGDRIKAINLLVRKMVERALKTDTENIRFTIDANGFYKAEVERIEGQAKALAAEVQSSKVDKEMPPMRAFDRLVAHAALTGMSNIKTESTGEGRERRVVVKYVA
jgi:spoIIIJ-associated protein